MHQGDAVFGHHQVAEQGALDREALLERHFVGLAHQPLDVRDGLGRLRRDPGGPGQSSRQHGHVHAGVDHAQAGCVLRPDHLPHQDQFERPGLPDQAGQALSAARAREDADVHFGQADRVVACLREPQVAGQRDFITAAHRGTVDRRDEDLARLLHPALAAMDARLGHRPLDRELQAAGRHRHRALLEHFDRIVAHEHAVVGAGQHDRPQGLVGLDGVQVGEQFNLAGVVEITVGRIAEGQHDDAGYRLARDDSGFDVHDAACAMVNAYTALESNSTPRRNR